MLPFFGKGMTSDCVHSFGHSFVSQIFWHITVRTVVVSLPFFSSSDGMVSSPGDITAFRPCKTSLTAFLSTYKLSASYLGVCLLWSRLVSGWSSFLSCDAKSRSRKQSSQVVFKPFTSGGTCGDTRVQRITESIFIQVWALWDGQCSDL